jgi:hypothetical protein
MTNIYIDTEFNSYKGDLISIGLVVKDGKQFYVSLGCDNPHPWVSAHVMPVLLADKTDKKTAQLLMQEWLKQFEAIHIVADWPEDIQHFCEFLITGPGERLATPPLTMEIDSSLNSKSSKVPHNALEDAKAIMRMHN